MKQSQITPEVIKFSKQIAEHWRMEIYVGCWYAMVWRDSTEVSLHYGVTSTTKEDVERVLNEAQERDLVVIIPIPSISDCLEKLEILEWYLIEATTYTCKTGIESYSVEVARGWDMEPHIMKGEKTLHLALLSALLEVLKNSDG